jgi:hypothetical protein
VVDGVDGYLKGWAGCLALPERQGEGEGEGMENAVGGWVHSLLGNLYIRICLWICS